ncbi:MAG: ATP-binding protein [Bacteroidota bacterium]
MAGAPRSLSHVWRRSRIRLWLLMGLLAGLAATAGVLAATGRTGNLVLVAVLGVGIAWVAFRVVRRAERPARDLRRFLDSVRADDMSVRFSSSGHDPLMDALAESFESVSDAFRKVRAEREEQAGYLEAVVRHVGVALIGFRTDGTVTLFNLAAGRTLSIPRPRSVESLRQRAPKTAAALEGLAPGERVLIRLDADDGPKELVAYATRFVIAGESHTLVSLQDIRQELETRELEAWQQLTRVLTHEITNSVAPISSLAGTAQTLLERQHTDDVREALGTIERRSRGLVAFVESYRTLARLPQPEPRVVPAAELLGDIATLMRVSTDHVEVSVEVEPDGLDIVADPDLIEQALVNIALNAVEAMEETAGAHLRLRAFVGQTGRPVVEVRDNGPGLLPEVVERVFVPFFSTKSTGSGIGLSLSQRIARLHGGTLTVTSEPDVETVFTLRL